MPDLKPIDDRQIDFKIFDSIINGELRPFLAMYSSEEFIDRMLHERNIVSFIWTGEKFIPATEKDFQKLEKVTSEGELITISIDEENPDGIGKMTIESDEILEPLIDLDIPPPPDKKSNYFLSVIEDEYNDIKKQAQNTLDESESLKKAQFIAEKRIQKLKNLASQAHRISKQLPSKGKSFTDDADLFVFYVLKKYLIRSILVYEELFQPFLTIPIQDEYTLMSDLYGENHSISIAEMRSFNKKLKDGIFKWMILERHPDRIKQSISGFEIDKLSIAIKTSMWKKKQADRAIELGFIGRRILAAILASEDIYTKKISGL